MLQKSDIESVQPHSDSTSTQLGDIIMEDGMVNLYETSAMPERRDIAVQTAITDNKDGNRNCGYVSVFQHPEGGAFKIDQRHATKEFAEDMWDLPVAELMSKYDLEFHEWHYLPEKWWNKDPNHWLNVLNRNSIIVDAGSNLGQEQDDATEVSKKVANPTVEYPMKPHNRRSASGKPLLTRTDSAGLKIYRPIQM
ncbi:hypothetical protein AMS68_005855 [Peltaster fructicola]|uniref:Uncharacterized protein n=1 Tax=Peltaster fructicola TaxID=286661 RepID=A0A6H0Y0G1_9PEZI|nr:hypothetical protein AMS68_005855 [Peltaster fructicola]